MQICLRIAFCLFVTLLMLPARAQQPDAGLERMVQEQTLAKDGATAAKKLNTPGEEAFFEARVTSASTLRAGYATAEVASTQPLRLEGLWSREREKPQPIAPVRIQALVFDDGRTRVGLALVDVFGLHADDVIDIAALQHAVDPDRLMVIATHTTQGPAVLGLTAPQEVEYLKRLKPAVASAIDQAAAQLIPATISFSTNSGMALKTGAACVTINRTGNLAGAPSRLTLAQAMPPTSQSLQMLFSKPPAGPIIWLPGSFVDGPGTYHPFSSTLPQLNIAFKSRLAGRSLTVAYPFTNPLMIKAVAARRLPITVDEGVVRARLTWLAIGPVELLAVPGELTPEATRTLGNMLGGTCPLVVGCAQGYVGTLIPPGQWQADGNREQLSVGRENARATYSAAARLLGVGGWVE